MLLKRFRRNKRLGSKAESELIIKYKSVKLLKHVVNKRFDVFSVHNHRPFEKSVFLPKIFQKSQDFFSFRLYNLIFTSLNDISFKDQVFMKQSLKVLESTIHGLTPDKQLYSYFYCPIFIQLCQLPICIFKHHGLHILL